MTRVLNKLLVLAVAPLLFSVCHAEGLEKGNLVGLHLVTVTLNAHVTLEEFSAAFVHDVVPEYEKNWPGLKGYLLKPFFRDSRHQLAIVWVFRTLADRNRNFDANDRANELERAALAKVKPVEDRFKQKYGSYTISYTHEDDWVVQ